MFFSSLPPEPIPHPHRAERAINWDIMKGWGERGGKERGDSKWEEGEKRTFFPYNYQGRGEDRERLQNKGEGERKEANASRITNIFEQRHFLKRPSLTHCTVGVGIPSALQLSVALSLPSLTTTADPASSAP